jgi:hypothetical protein
MSRTNDASKVESATKPNAGSETEPESVQFVGYGKPPIVTRFRKGVSGNPKGRPKGSLNVVTVFTKTLREKVVIKEHGRRKTVTKLEAAMKQLVNKAASGDLRALRQSVELARDAEARPNTPGLQNSATDELDHEVIDGILKRFRAGEEESRAIEEKD